MRNALYALPIIAAAAFATPAMAQPAYGPYGPYAYEPYASAAPWVAGAATGTTVALGAYNGWFGGQFAGTSAAATAGAAAIGGTAAIGAVAFVDGVLQPCRGFHAVFGLNHGACEERRTMSAMRRRRAPEPRRYYR